MAVKNELKKPKLVKDFLPKYRTQMSLYAFSLGLIPTAGSALVLHFSGILPATELLFYAAIILIAVFSFGLLSLVFILASKPLLDLFAAIIHVSGELHDTPPPNPNQTKYVKNGLDEALKTIYELGGSKSSEHKKSSSTTSKINLHQALDTSRAGFAVLDQKKNVIYSNKNTPLHTADDELSLQLLFHGSDTLDEWIDQCQESSVHAERAWTRVPDRPSDQEGQKIYDVFASFEKGTEYETVVTLVDRTNTYTVDEEDLNFIAFAAHELRGPITVIRGYLDVLQMELEGKLEYDQEELFQRLTVSANRLSGYISNILNTSRYDRRHLKVNLAEDNLAAIYDTMKDDMNLRASAQSRILNISIPDSLPTIAADRSSLTEVIGNLIDNAIKYSNEGGVIAVNADQKGDFIELSVKDNGIGMPPSVVKNLFQKFYRSHRSRETVAGSGIGLYISKAITESHGGQIGVRSAEGEGSTFTISLPTYASVADKLQLNNNSNEDIISSGNGWIKNHSMYRG